MATYDCLSLDNQVCFPLYACAKEIVRRYRPYLEPLGLTYTQYIAMMALWEHRGLSVKELGNLLFLDSGTLTPLLKKLEDKGWIVRTRDPGDERVVTVTVTDSGMGLRDKALNIPSEMAACIDIGAEDAVVLGRILRKMMATFRRGRSRALLSAYY